jgi:hypothetical protein
MFENGVCSEEEEEGREGKDFSHGELHVTL